MGEDYYPGQRFRENDREVLKIEGPLVIEG